jgi:asparagine synthase (glutamine-hydrolysing)
MLVSRLAREQVKVVLNGDGGDELFFGYNSYTLMARLHALLTHCPGIFRAAAGSLMQIAAPLLLPLFKNNYHFPLRYHKLLRILKDSCPENILRTIHQQLSPYETKQLLYLSKGVRPDWHSASDFLPGLQGVFHRQSGTTAEDLNRILALDYKTYLADDILVKTDRATMAVSLEGRVPYLDHRIVEFTAQLPLALKYKDKVNKYLLKKITARYLPASLMERPKRGFGMPLQAWFGPLLTKRLQELVSTEQPYLKELIDFNVLEKMFIRNQQKPSVPFNLIWYFYTFLTWHKHWMR